MSVHWSLENAHQAHVRTWMARSDVSVLLDTSCRMTNVKVCTEQSFSVSFSAAHNCYLFPLHLNVSNVQWFVAAYSSEL